MFQKILKGLKKISEPPEPRQGKRLLCELTPDGAVRFTIKGTTLPGFFVFFGGIFLVVSLVMLTAILFGTPSPDSPIWGTAAALLFLLPFLTVGIVTFSLGIFLWLGKSLLTLTPSAVTLERILFGKAFQTKKIDRSGLNIRFKKSHEENNVARYKLSFESTGKKFGLGSSLKEAELLWLNQEVRKVLGKQEVVTTDLASALQAERIAEVENASVDPNYRSNYLSFSKTITGWQAQTQGGAVGKIFSILFGAIFLTAGLIMEGTLARYLMKHWEWFRKLAESQSGDAPPLWFAMVFAGVGALIILGGVLSLGFRARIEKRHSRLKVTRSYYGLGKTHIIEISEIIKLELKSNGRVNEEPRFSLKMHLRNGNKLKLLSFGRGEDAGQLRAWIEAERVRATSGT